MRPKHRPDPIAAMAAMMDEDINQNNGLRDVPEPIQPEPRQEWGESPIPQILSEMKKVQRLKDAGEDTIPAPMINVNRIRERRALEESWRRERLAEQELVARSVARPLPSVSPDIRIIGASPSRFIFPEPTPAPASEPIVEQAEPIPLTAPGQRKLRF
jgi:hypothetical protein